jgi:2-dehydropantoate 2-reductase
LNIKTIGIIGVGGVGGYFGGKLCSLQQNGSRASISFVARGEHLRAIQKSGLLLSSESDGDFVCRPSLATDDFQRLPPLDLCLICVKEFDLPGALSRLAPLISDETILLPLLNGVDVYSRVRSVIQKGVVLPACVYLGTHIERPGKICQKGGACRILFGPDPQRPGLAPQEVIRVFERAGIKSEWTSDIQVEIWKKFIFISTYGLVCAARDKTLGEVLDDAELKAEVGAMMMEASALAKASGVRLPHDIVEVSLLKAQDFPPAAKTSFQRDFERQDKPDERDLFGGAIIRIADRMNVPVPRTRAVFAGLAKKKPAQPNAAGRLGDGE